MVERRNGMGSQEDDESGAPRPHLSPHANVRELKYRDDIQRLSDSAAGFVNKVRASGRLRLLPYLREHDIAKPSGNVLEIGAGSGWLSAELSKLSAVEAVTTVDFSNWLVNDVMPEVFGMLGAASEKITRRMGDFHDMPFLAPASFDWVFADSALHHATDVHRLLAEICRVLKPDGRLVGLREPVRPLFAWKLKHTRQDTVDALHEHGVEEPLYSRREWSAFFRSAGFRVRWEPLTFSTGWRGAASRLANGIVKADYVILGAKR
jgi:SAM-dependent methyltransferase